MQSSKPGIIVLVEDDSDDQELFKDTLTSLSIGNKVLIFSTGLDALDYLNTTTDQPFIIICDINLPRMNGLELREEIMSSEKLKRKSIPFIFFSTNASKTTIEKAYDLTVQGFFQKPVSVDELNRVLKMIVDYWSTCKHPNN